MPFKVDFLFPVLAKQNLACGQVGGKFHDSHYVNYHTCTQFDTVTDALYICLFTKLATW